LRLPIPFLRERKKARTETQSLQDTQVFSGWWRFRAYLPACLQALNIIQNGVADD